MRLVQLAREGKRRVALVEGEELRLLAARWADIYSLAMEAADARSDLASAVRDAETSEALGYGPIYKSQSDWRLLPAFDQPSDAAHCMVSGTGLTHKASAENRSAMHKTAGEQVTDSARMYELGLTGGSPPWGEIGVQPEWFFKGDGSVLRAHGQELTIPAYGWDGGEEPEIAGVYLVSRNGEPLRVGLTVGNEFSDHQMEKRNYLYLAPSKLRECALGPELTVGETEFEDVSGTVSVWRQAAPLWNKKIWTGQKNMSHTVANLEHHHFKYEAHRRPGDVHIHFFGADAFSFGDGVELAAGDVMEVSFPAFGRALRNPLRVMPKPEGFFAARAL